MKRERRALPHVSWEEVETAIERINQGLVGDVNESNAEVLVARSKIDVYLASIADSDKKKRVEERIKRELGIGDYQGSTNFNFTDGVVGDGTNKTAKIEPSNDGTGLPEQVKTPRGLRDKSFIVTNKNN